MEVIVRADGEAESVDQYQNKIADHLTRKKTARQERGKGDQGQAIEENLSIQPAEEHRRTMQP
jgi:hypothetical protein